MPTPEDKAREEIDKAFEKLLQAIALGNTDAQDGGLGKVHQLFGNELNKLIEELNGTLAA